MLDFMWPGSNRPPHGGSPKAPLGGPVSAVGDQPYGSPAWAEATARLLGIRLATRPRGRPSKAEKRTDTIFPPPFSPIFPAVFPS